MKELAEVLLLAAKLREESYDKIASEEASKSKKLIDFNKFYKKSIEQSVIEAYTQLDFKISANAFFPAYLLLKYCWNDSLNWAESIVE